MDRVTPVLGRSEASQPLLTSTETRLTSAVRLWLLLLTAELVLFVASSAFYSVNEGWSFERSMFVSVSIGFGIGLPYQTSEATALVAAANALVGFALLAFAASLLVRHIVLRQEQVRKEVREEIRESEITYLTHLTMLHEDAEQPQSGAPAPPPPSNRSTLRRLRKDLSKSLRAARGQLCTKRGRRRVLLVLWLAFWVVGLLTFAESLDAVQGPQERKYGKRVYGLLYIISVFTTSSINPATPEDNAGSYLWAAAFIVAGVPLTATVYASFIDVYIAHVERREARRALLHVGVPSRSTFLSMGHGEERRTLTGAKVDWGAYLEYRLRTMPGTVVHEKLLDGLRATFAAIDRNNNGYIEWRDIEATCGGASPELCRGAGHAESPELLPEDRYSAPLAATS